MKVLHVRATFEVPESFQESEQTARAYVESVRSFLLAIQGEELLKKDNSGTATPTLLSLDQLGEALLWNNPPLLVAVAVVEVENEEAMRNFHLGEIQ